MRYGLVVYKPEIDGFRAGVSHREIVEAVFVEGADSTTAAWCLAGIQTTQSIADVFIARGIDFRFAHRATAPDLAVASSAKSVDPNVWITSDSTADGTPVETSTGSFLESRFFGVTLPSNDGRSDHRSRSCVDLYEPRDHDFEVN